MKKLLAIFVALFAFSVYAKDIQELVVTTTPPMSCQNCENRIKGNLRFEKGVKKIETNLAEQLVTVTFDADKTTPEAIEEAFSKIGYKVEVINPDEERSYEAKKGESKKSESDHKCGGCNGSGSCCKSKK